VSLNPIEYLTVASSAKLIAAAVTYPHEVVRTRLREQRGQNSRYTGFIQCLSLIAKEEGVKGLYGGMGAHLLRVVPNAAIM
jgi:solute carrier family 25 protein 33/36